MSGTRVAPVARRALVVGATMVGTAPVVAGAALADGKSPPRLALSMAIWLVLPVALWFGERRRSFDRVDDAPVDARVVGVAADAPAALAYTLLLALAAPLAGYEGRQYALTFVAGLSLAMGISFLVTVRRLRAFERRAGIVLVQRVGRLGGPLERRPERLLRLPTQES
jgi:hypothetical protein